MTNSMNRNDDYYYSASEAGEASGALVDNTCCKVGANGADCSNCGSCGCCGCYDDITEAELAAIRKDMRGWDSATKSWGFRKSYPPKMRGTEHGRRAYYVWRMTRFDGGVDRSMPMVAMLMIDGESKVVMSKLDELVAELAEKYFGTSMGGAATWLPLLGMPTNREAGSVGLTALAGLGTLGILAAIHWPLVLVALAAMTLYRVMNTGTAQGWYRLAPKQSGSCSKMCLGTAQNADADADADADAATASGECGTQPTFIMPAVDMPVGLPVTTVVAEIPTECAPRAAYPRAKVAALDAAVCPNGLLERRAYQVARLLDMPVTIGEVHRHSPVAASLTISSSSSSSRVARLVATVEQRRVAGRFAPGYQVVVREA